MRKTEGESPKEITSLFDNIHYVLEHLSTFDDMSQFMRQQTFNMFFFMASQQLITVLKGP